MSSLCIQTESWQSWRKYKLGGPPKEDHIAGKCRGRTCGSCPHRLGSIPRPATNKIVHSQKNKEDQTMSHKVYQDHHILPESRGGKRTKQNMKTVQDKYHEAFHLIFHNLTPQEQIEYLEEVWHTNKPFITPQEWRNNY